MVGTWRETQKADRRQQFLSAAAELFAQRGYRAVSIEELGAAIGVRGPALYRHFDSKETVLVELLVSASERLLSGFEAVAAEGGDELTTLRALIRFHTDFALEEQDVIRIQDRELANLPEASNRLVRRLQRRYIDGWGGIVARLRPELSEAELRVRLHAAFGVLNSTPFDADAAAEPVVRDVLAASAEAVLLR